MALHVHSKNKVFINYLLCLAFIKSPNVSYHIGTPYIFAFCNKLYNSIKGNYCDMHLLLAFQI